MSRWAYLALIVVVLGSVGLGLDWQPASLSPMPEPKSAVPPASIVPRNKTDGPNGALSPVYPASPGLAGVPPSQTVETARPPLPPAPAAGASAAASVPPNCNVRACAAAYRSFLAADCTYQPLNGPRRRCQKR